MERGILGLPKKKSVLFSFQSRKGEECPSDSEDSDYYPGRKSTDEEDEATILRNMRRKRLKKQKAKKSGKEHNSSTTVKTRVKTNVQTSGADGSILCLPPEIMLRVFRYAIATQGFVVFISRVSKVCKEWHRMSSDVSLWTRLDLTWDHVHLTKLKVDSLLLKDLSLCRHLDLSGQTKLQPQAIVLLLEAMPLLEHLDLAGCSCIKSDLVGKKIPELCPNLERIDLSSSFELNVNLSMNAIEGLIKGRGKKLKELHLCRISVVGSHISAVLELIAANCPNLEVLNLVLNEYQPERRCELNLDNFVRALPLLKDLRLDGVNWVDRNSTEDKSPGLKHLKFYSHRRQVHGSMDIPVFYRMFSPETSLVELSICRSNLLPRHITRLVKNVERLNMSGMRWKDPEYVNLFECIDAWGTTLTHLDISRNVFTNNIIDAALYRIPMEECVLSPLQSLSLNSTNVTSSGVVYILDACKDLQFLDLTSCRELPRGSKRIFRSSEFPQLKKILQAELGEDSDGWQDESDNSQDETEDEDSDD